MRAAFERFEIEMTLRQAQDASHQGQCAPDVEELMREPKIARQLRKIGPDAIRAELAEYGGWDDEELTDDAENRLRIVWIAAGNIQEELYEAKREKEWLKSRPAVNC